MPLPSHAPRRAVPLKLLLVVPFVLQTFAAVGLVGFLSFRNGQRAVNYLAGQLMSRTSSSVDQHLDSYLAAPHQVTALNADAIRMGVLDVNDRETLSRYFWQQMQVYDLHYIGFGLETGAGGGAARYNPNFITIDDWDGQPVDNWRSYATDDQGNRTKLVDTLTWNNFEEDWYTEPIAAGGPVWSPVVTINYPDFPYVAVSASRPIYNGEDQLLGMVAADVHLLSLSEFLGELEASQQGSVFILERDGLLLAKSGGEPPFLVEEDGDIQRVAATESTDAMVQAVSQQLHHRFGEFGQIETGQMLRLDLADEPHYVNVTPWQDEFGLDWLVVVGMPESAFMAQINANTRTTVLLCLWALVVTTFLGILTAQRISKPITQLSLATDHLAKGDLSQRLSEGNIKEMNVLTRAFNSMAQQLQTSFQALAKNNELLESRVEARTAELQQALDELQQTQTQMVQSEKMSSLGQLVAGVAHEINNPVNFIHGNLSHTAEYSHDLLELVSLYQQRYPEPDAEIQAEIEQIDLDFMRQDLPKILASMKVGTERIRQIVLSLRNFSRIDEAEIKPVDLHDGLDSTLMILQHRLKPTSQRPEIQLVKHYGKLPLVECYAGQMNQVFMNILTNAIDAVEEKYVALQSKSAESGAKDLPPYVPTLEIRTRSLGAKTVEIAIADNGNGIPEAVKARIFNPFFTTKPVGKGTGMGMSISHQIVTEKHSGQIDCHSTPGKGTEFWIQIPIRH
jgi:signal transduction histidine kinase